MSDLDLTPRPGVDDHAVDITPGQQVGEHETRRSGADDPTVVLVDLAMRTDSLVSLMDVRLRLS